MAEENAWRILSYCITKIIEIENDDEDKVDENMTNNQEGSENEEEQETIRNVVTPTPVRPTTKLRGELQRLNTTYNKEAQEMLKSINENLNKSLEEEANTETGREMDNDATRWIMNTLEKNFAFMTQNVMIKLKGDNIENGKKYGKQEISFQEAWYQPNPIIRGKWRAAIRKEFSCMIKRKIWRKIKRSQVPRN